MVWPSAWAMSGLISISAMSSGWAEPLLERLDLVADRRLGHVQLIGRMSKTKVPCRCLEGTHGI